jgi:hypothetical protein
LNYIYFFIAKTAVMTSSAKSVCYFGFYLYIVGLTLLFVPNLFLRTIRAAETHEVWIRVVGILVFCIAYYYHRNGAANNKSMFRFTVHARVFVCLAFAVLVLAKLAPPVLAGFGGVDLLGALWTWKMLQKETRPGNE